MDQGRFQEAKKAYDEGDYRAAAKGFLAAAGRGTEGNGLSYYMAGNSLLKLRRYSDAVTVYGHALRDDLFDKRGAALSNLAIAHVALGEYAEAVDEYKAALEEPDYKTPYKALQGMAGAMVEMGRYEDAAIAYRQAALDAENPDPGKALNNLGLCFMAMGRPSDAIEAYKAALGFDEYKGRGRALMNMGIAYHVMGEHEQAVRSFEKASGLHGYELPPHAVKALEASRAALPKREVVEGWETGEIPPVLSTGAGEGDLDVTSTDGWLTEAAPEADASSSEVAAGTTVPQGDAVPAGSEMPGLDSDDEFESAFFTRTEEEMKEIDRAERRRERALKREHRSPWLVVLAALSVLVVIVGVLAAAFFLGFGYPTQSMTVSGMLEAHANLESVDSYWVAVPASDVEKEMAKIPPMSGYSIESVDRSPRTSRVVVTVTPKSGTPLTYEITLAREGVGWKVTGVEIVL